jgi:hypothetical protein
MVFYSMASRDTPDFVPTQSSPVAVGVIA